MIATTSNRQGTAFDLPPEEIAFRHPPKLTAFSRGYRILRRTEPVRAPKFHLDEDKFGTVLRDEVDLATAEDEVPFDNAKSDSLQQFDRDVLARRAGCPVIRRHANLRLLNSSGGELRKGRQRTKENQTGTVG